MTKKKTANKAKPTTKAGKKPSNSKAAGTKSARGTVKATAKSKTAKKTAAKTAAKTTKAKVVVARPAKAKKVSPKVKDEGRILAESVVNGMLEKKAQNVKWLDLRGIENSVCDYFIICEGGSNTQVEAIADSVEETVKKETAQRPYRSEGWENALWILIDYVNVVVHVFERETRYFYNLESLWADAEEIPVKQ